MVWKDNSGPIGGILASHSGPDMVGAGGSGAGGRQPGQSPGESLEVEHMKLSFSPPTAPAGCMWGWNFPAGYQSPALEQPEGQMLTVGGVTQFQEQPWAGPEGLEHRCSSSLKCLPFESELSLGL